MLKTKCNNCVFSNNLSCLLKKTTMVADGQYTLGFCRQKRNNNWVRNVNLTSLSNQVRKIQDEEGEVDIVIIGHNIDGVKITARSINKKRFVIVVLFDERESDVANLANYLNDLGLKWTIRNVKEAILVENVPYVALNDLKHNWFYTVHSGNLVDDDTLYFIKETLKGLDDNTVCFYHKEDDPIQIIVNKFAFNELDGNFDKMWFEKVKEFSNWKEVCKPI